MGGEKHDALGSDHRKLQNEQCRSTLAPCSHFTQSAFGVKCGSKVHVSSGNWKPQTHFLGFRLLPEVFRPPVSHCCHLSGTFDDHLTDLTNVTDAVGAGAAVGCSEQISLYNVHRLLEVSLQRLYTVSLK